MSIGVPADAVDVLGVLRCDWSEVAKITGRVLMVHACREPNTFRDIGLQLTISLLWEKALGVRRVRGF